MALTVNEETAKLYGNIMDEVKSRLAIIERTLAQPTHDILSQVAASDLCAVQFRKVFEGIALGCLALHGDVPEANKLKKDVYRADTLLNGLGKLHPDFYPKPCRIVVKPTGEARVQLATRGDWLTKEALRKCYFQFDHELHVGTLTRRKLGATIVAPTSFARILLLTRTLLWDHVISFRDPNFRLLAEMDSVTVSIQSRDPDTSP